MDHPAPPARYEIRVRGCLGETLLGAFPGLRAEAHEGETVLAGALPDQAALFGVLAQLEALGIELLEVRRARRNQADRVTTAHPARPDDSGSTPARREQGTRTPSPPRRQRSKQQTMETDEKSS